MLPTTFSNCPPIKVRSFLALLCCGVVSMPGFGQKSKPREVVGKVVDATSDKGLPGATVTAYSQEASKLLAGTSTDTTGTFRLRLEESRNVVLSFSSVGYKKRNLALADFDAMASVALQPDSTLLKEVKVRGFKNILTMESTRLTYDVGSLEDVEYMTMSQLMDQMAFVDYGDGKMKFMGESITILINDKPHGVFSDPKNFSQIPLHAIEKIEMRIVPSARTDGRRVMNVVMKSNYFLGWNGAANASQSRFSSGGGGRASYWSKKFGGDLAVQASRSTAPFESQTDVAYLRTGSALERREDRDNKNSSLSGNALAYYNIDDKNQLDLVAYVSVQDNTSDAVYGIKQTSRDGTITQDRSNQSRDAGVAAGGLGLNYTRKFDAPTRHFYFLNQFSTGQNDDSYLLTRAKVAAPGEVPSRDIYAGESSNRSFSTEVVYQDIFKEKIEYTFGSKFIDRNRQSDENRLVNTGDSLTASMLDFQSRQLVSASYLDVETKLGAFSLSGGLRFEYAEFRFDSQKEANRTFYNFLPLLSLSRKLGEQIVAQLNYSRRLLRPSLSSFVPFTTASDPLMTQVGFAGLDPQYTHDLSTGIYSNHTWGSLGVNLSYSRTRNLNRDRYDVAGDTVVVTSANVDLNQSLTLGLSGRVRLSSKLSANVNTNGSLVWQETGPYRYRLLMGYIDGRIIYQPTKKQTFVLAFNAHSPNLELQGRDQSLAYLSTVLNYNLFIKFSDKLSGNLGVSLVNPWYWDGLPGYSERNTENLTYYTAQSRGNALIAVALSVNFVGKQFQGKTFSRQRGIDDRDIKVD